MTSRLKGRVGKRIQCFATVKSIDTSRDRIVLSSVTVRDTGEIISPQQTFSFVDFSGSVKGFRVEFIGRVITAIPGFKVVKPTKVIYHVPKAGVDLFV